MSCVIRGDGQSLTPAHSWAFTQTYPYLPFTVLFITAYCV